MCQVQAGLLTFIAQDMNQDGICDIQVIEEEFIYAVGSSVHLSGQGAGEVTIHLKRLVLQVLQLVSEFNEVIGDTLRVVGVMPRLAVITEPSSLADRTVGTLTNRGLIQRDPPPPYPIVDRPRTVFILHLTTTDGHLSEPGGALITTSSEYTLLTLTLASLQVTRRL